MTQEQINELRRLAQAATPGPWAVNDDPLINEGAPHLMTEDGYAIADFWGNESSLGLKGNERNAAYIAAANPAAILAMIQQRDELLAAWKEYQNSDFSVSCQRGVVGKCMCAKCTHDRASALFSKAETQS